MLIPHYIADAVKQQVHSDTFQEEDDQQAEEEQQAATTILEPVEPEVNPEMEDPVPTTNHETPDNDDYEYDYDQLKVKSQTMKERKKLS